MSFGRRLFPAVAENEHNVLNLSLCPHFPSLARQRQKLKPMRYPLNTWAFCGVLSFHSGSMPETQVEQIHTLKLSIARSQVGGM